MKVAFTSSNGTFVDKHFGESESFFVFEMSHTGNKFLDARIISGNYVTQRAKYAKKSRIEVVFEVISDCSVLYTSRIGDDAALWLETKGIRSIIYKGDISKIVQINNLIISKTYY